MRTILAVDDRKEILAGIEQLLSKEWQVIAVNSRAMALKFLQQRLPHLVLVNTEMAEMDGLRLCVEMRENEKWEKIPVERITYPFDASALKQRVELLLLEGAQEDNTYLPVIKAGKIAEIAISGIANQNDARAYKEMFRRSIPECRRRIADQQEIDTECVRRNTVYEEWQRTCAAII